MPVRDAGRRERRNVVLPRQHLRGGGRFLASRQRLLVRGAALALAQRFRDRVHGLFGHGAEARQLAADDAVEALAVIIDAVVAAQPVLERPVLPERGPNPGPGAEDARAAHHGEGVLHGLEQVFDLVLRDTRASWGRDLPECSERR